MKTHIYFILDESGSMGTRQSATISGFNEYLENIQKDPNLEKAKFSLIKFNARFFDVVVNEKLKNVPPLTGATYSPGGMTALYDAVAHVLSYAETNVKDTHRVLVVILTDGEENSSKEHTRQQIFDMIKRFEKKGNYTFVFLGCDQDVWAEGGKIGMEKGNVKAFDPNDIKSAYQALTGATRSYAGGQSARSSFFWGEDNKND